MAPGRYFMAPGTKGGFYAVQVGHKPGVYTTWNECSAQVLNFSGAKYKKFPTLQQAQAFVAQGAGLPSAARRPSSAPVVAVTPAPNTRASEAADAIQRTVKRLRQDHGGPDDAPAGQEDARKVVRADSSERRTVFCSGSAKMKGMRGAVAGIGVFWAQGAGAYNLSERLPGKPQTNNRAEMYAVARVLQTDPRPDLPLTICSDSQYTISVFSQWIPTWKKRDWKTAEGKPVANQDLIRYIISLLALRTPAGPSSQQANITFRKVKAHVGIDGDEQADRLAHEGALLPKVPDRNFAWATEENERTLRQRKRGVTVATDVTWLVKFEMGDLLDEQELKDLENQQDS